MDKKGIEKSIESFFEKGESLSKAQRIAVSVIFFAAIAAIFTYFLYWPKFEKINSLKEQVTGLEQKLSIAKRNAADLGKFQTQMREAQAEFNMAMKKLPEKEEIPSLLTAISDSGQQVGLEFLLFEPKKEKKKEFYAEIPVAMSLKGDYHNLAIFFDQVARLNRIVDITNIQMTRAKGKDQAARELAAKCTAVTYKFLDEPPKKKSKKKRRKKK